MSKLELLFDPKEFAAAFSAVLRTSAAAKQAPLVEKPRKNMLDGASTQHASVGSVLKGTEVIG